MIVSRSKEIKRDEEIVELEVGDSKVSCGECSKLFNNIDEGYSHMESVHTEMPVFNCGICGEIFGSESEVSRHNRVKHEIHPAKILNKTTST